MRQPDINRVKRAMEHIHAAIVSISNIKSEHMNGDEEWYLRRVKDELAYNYRQLRDMDKNVEKFKGYPKPFSEIQEDPYDA